MSAFPERPPRKAAETPDQQFDHLLEQLPEEIREKWESQNDTIPSEELLSKLQDFIQRRRAIVENKQDLSFRERPTHVEVLNFNPLAIQQLIESMEHGDEQELGRGKAGRVVASVRNQDVCYKVMFPISKLPQGTNSVAHEADLQQEIYELGEISGVRAPKVIAYVENSSIRAIMMEQLDAVSIRDLLHEKEPWPDSFDIDRFIASLEAYMEGLHDKGYYHRDFHDGNVLVDRVTGMPRVIDFGYSKRVFGDDDPYRQEYVESGQRKTLVLSSDSGGLDHLKQLLVSKQKEMSGSTYDGA